MKVGSLCETIVDWSDFQIKGVVFPVKGVTYTVRDILTKSGVTGIVLEEIKNPDMQHSDGYGEPYFHINNFRELLSPDDLDLGELLKEPKLDFQPQ